MQIRVISAAQLSAADIAAWSRLQQSDPALASPFFRPEFTQVMAAARSDVEVAIWETGDGPVCFLPFEHRRRGRGRPVGSHINEFQGAICKAGVAWSPRDVVKAAGLRSWRFDHLSSTQHCFAPYQYVVAESPFIDLSQGFEHYLASRENTWSKKLRQKERKADRELGAVRLAVHGADRHAFNKLLEWKADHCHRTGRPCIYGIKWVVKSFESLLEHASRDFSGMLFCLYFGDRLGAVEFNVRSGGTLHGIISAYDRSLGQFAPGLILTMRAAQAASKDGITRIDLGKGDEPYKRDLASASDQVAEGVVHSRPMRQPLYHAWVRAKNLLRTTWMRGLVWRMQRWTMSTNLPQ